MLYAKTVPVSDYEGYRRLAAALLDHGQYGYPEPSARRSPGYPVFLASLMCISRSVTWLSLVNVILSSLICALVFRLSYGLFRRYDVALIASLLCALNPTFVFYGPVLASEHLFTLLVLAAVLLGLTKARRPRLCAAAAGLAMGAAVLTRMEAMFYLPIVCGLFFRSRAPGEPGARFVLLQPSLVAIVAACVVAPWYIRNELVVGPGAGLGTGGGIAFYLGHNPGDYGYRPTEETPLRGLSEVAVSTEGYRLGLEYVKSNSRSLWRSIYWGTYCLYRPSAGAVDWSIRLPREKRTEPWPTKSLAFVRPARILTKVAYALLLCTAFLSLLTIRAWPLRSICVVAALLFLNWLCNAALFLGDPRYRYLPEVLFCICAGIVIARLLAPEAHAAKSPLTGLAGHEAGDS